MNVLDYIKSHVTLLDGGMGTLLQERGLKPGEEPVIWNIKHPEVIIQLQKMYYDAGSNIVSTNTFGCNSLKFSKEELTQIIEAAVKNTKAAREVSKGTQEKFIALNLGPCGKMLKPYGDLEFEDAVRLFAEVVNIGVKFGVDLIYIETMNDSYETKAALLAAKENSNLPVFVSNAYGEDSKLMTGATPEAMIAMLEAMGADAIGINCSYGPKVLKPIAEKYLKYASVPVILKANAGVPKVVKGETFFDVLPEEFSDDVAALVKSGVRICGGCCGTTPEYIKQLHEKAANLPIKAIRDKGRTVVSSYTHAVTFDEKPVLIGERINPTGKKRFKQALKANDLGYILNEGINQQEMGVHILDVNVGLPDIDEVAMMKKVTFELQAIIDLPLQIDTSNPAAMEAALRSYNGKALVNSVNGKEESMSAIFPLVKKYGGVVVALTLDDNGIPNTAEERVAIAEKILKRAEAYGIAKKDIIFDTLTMTISADNKSAMATLKALEYIRNKIGCHTSLGVSNISFGLPAREAVNSTFFANALERGLSAAIMNPFSAEMLQVYYAFIALNGMDEACTEYIDFMQNKLPKIREAVATLSGEPSNNIAFGKATPREVGNNSINQVQNSLSDELQKSIMKGLKDGARVQTKKLLETKAPLDIVNNDIVPALDKVGAGYEEKRIFLPQLLMSAEAAQSAFEEIKGYMSINQGKEENTSKCTCVVATVEGDIHDIGKNIVKLLLENYGFDVHDLGKDVKVDTIVEEVVKLHASVCGLSALMTTTVPAMEETIKALREKAPWCKVVVGGAVLNQEYADNIGSDKYAGDAMETVRYAEIVNKQ